MASPNRAKKYPFSLYFYNSQNKRFGPFHVARRVQHFGPFLEPIQFEEDQTYDHRFTCDFTGTAVQHLFTNKYLRKNYLLSFEPSHFYSKNKSPLPMTKMYFYHSISPYNSLYYSLKRLEMETFSTSTSSKWKHQILVVLMYVSLAIVSFYRMIVLMNWFAIVLSDGTSNANLSPRNLILYYLLLLVALPITYTVCNHYTCAKMRDSTVQKNATFQKRMLSVTLSIANSSAMQHSMLSSQAIAKLLNDTNESTRLKAGYFRQMKNIETMIIMIIMISAITMVMAIVIIIIRH
ncbi:hypothetical protein RFI_15403 [Reticulomyxa filosa]|uniref:Uncharacterized protein n=1 Tax=Reticulomyxa filosa TaxID=46433 RepID=X6N917_RETFI|nr:hypothetical protein RFI_15403 [Reticulomyxa filosa]|eukprot:ETO21797.1 hypothetical protein RFI_15403 [Reticulomyxa filosa]